MTKDVSYQPDVLGEPFEQATLVMNPDYEGEVEATLVRHGAPGHKRALLYVHGFNDYFFQREMAEEINSVGLDFYAVDLRKYGRSLRDHQKMNNCRSVIEYFEEIRACMDIIMSEGNHESISLMGHSTGGLTVPLFADISQSVYPIDRVVLNSPFWDFNVAPLLRTAGIPTVSVLGAFLPDIPLKPDITPFYGESLHTDYRGEWNYNLDWKPIIPPPVNFGWIRAIYTGQQELQDGLDIEAPVLCMHSDCSFLSKSWTDDYFRADAVLNIDHMKEHVDKIGSKVEQVEISGGMHDLFLSKPDVRATAYKTLREFLK